MALRVNVWLPFASGARGVKLRAVAIHRRGTDGRGITVKIDINRRASLSAPVQGRRRIVR